jgi:hypothetical protein
MEIEKTHTFNLLECSCADITSKIEEMQQLEGTIKLTDEQQSKSNKFSRMLKMAYE